MFMVVLASIVLLLAIFIHAEIGTAAMPEDDSAEGCRPDTPSPYWQEALEATRQPVRPGRPGVHPFWNGHSKRFMYAPAFDFESRANAETYRVVAYAEADSQQYTTTIDQPWSAFPTLWQQLPCDRITLTVEAIAANGEVIDTVGSRSFLKSPAFNGPYDDPPYSYRESARKSLHALLHQDRIQHWLEHGEPGEDYWGWANPSKVMGALISGMVHYATHFPDAQDAEMARRLACIVADFLLTLREPANHRLAHWPLTYWDGIPSGRHPIQPDQIKTNFVVDAGMAFLDLYDITRDTTYYQAALNIAETFAAVRTDAGTWPQMFDRETGQAAANSNLLIPTWVILFLDRLHKEYGLTQFQSMRDEALQWCLQHPVETYGWYAQFLDTPPGERYKNMSRDEVNELTIILLTAEDAVPEHEQIALELLRFAEDQFVVWDQRDPVLRTRWFRKGSMFDGTGPEGSDWFVPSALEQYKFYTPISESNTMMIESCLAAYHRTGRSIYRAKAVSMANTLVRAQLYHGGGEIPTHLRRTSIDDDFIHTGIYSALTLLEHADTLSGSR
jgi:maltose/maltodextrin transport system substrate-binding protein